MDKGKIKGVDLIELVKNEKKETVETFLEVEGSDVQLNFEISSYSINTYRLPKNISEIIEKFRGYAFSSFPGDKIDDFIRDLKEEYNLRDVYFIYNQDEDYRYFVNDLFDKIIIADFNMSLMQFSASLLSAEDQMEFNDIK